MGTLNLLSEVKPMVQPRGYAKFAGNLAKQYFVKASSATMQVNPMIRPRAKSCLALPFVRPSSALQESVEDLTRFARAIQTIKQLVRRRKVYTKFSKLRTELLARRKRRRTEMFAVSV